MTASCDFESHLGVSCSNLPTGFPRQEKSLVGVVKSDPADGAISDSRTHKHGSLFQSQQERLGGSGAEQLGLRAPNQVDPK